MGLFDFFKRGGGGAEAQERALMRHAERVQDKRAMSPDRFGSIEYLCQLGTEEAWRALLPRYNFTVDPSITDREEKQYIFDQISKATDTAVDPVKEYLRKAPTAVNWSLKMLRELLDREAFVAELLSLLEAEDTSYQKNPERKLQAIIHLEELPDPRVTPALLRFLDDVSEDARFHTVRTLLAQGDESAGDPLFELLGRDESMRVKTTIADGLSDQGRQCPEEHRERVASVLPRIPTGPFSFDSEGRLSRPSRR